MREELVAGEVLTLAREKECARKFRATSFLRIISCGGEKNRRTKLLDDFLTGLPTIIEEDEEEEEATPLKIKAKKATARYHRPSVILTRYVRFVNDFAYHPALSAFTRI